MMGDDEGRVDDLGRLMSRLGVIAGFLGGKGMTDSASAVREAIGRLQVARSASPPEVRSDPMAGQIEDLRARMVAVEHVVGRVANWISERDEDWINYRTG